MLLLVTTPQFMIKNATSTASQNTLAKKRVHTQNEMHINITNAKKQKNKKGGVQIEEKALKKKPT